LYSATVFIFGGKIALFFERSAISKKALFLRETASEEAEGFSFSDSETDTDTESGSETLLKSELSVLESDFSLLKSELAFLESELTFPETI
jgi:hypothetical protein